MYLIKWIEDGKEKSIVADSWICKDVLIEELQEKQVQFVSELI